MGESFATALTAILTGVGDVVAEAFTWVTMAGSAITENAVLFIFAVAVPLVGLGVGLFKRLASNL